MVFVFLLAVVVYAYDSAMPSPPLLYAVSTNPGVVYRYLGNGVWEPISPVLGYVVLDLVEYGGHLYAAVTTEPSGYRGVGRVYRYEGNGRWTLVGDGLDGAVIRLIV
ncbi:hypothetical protein Pogu_2047 [Pyrobaculum oguniense TE7]|uniref:Uncharacterized protein n=1 Tax=Pyrobaculum oguniense (strain DSM 13380 / JCM 10595 / TE7) TaxID=698757 RepID=H6QB77_PYROT|nr:hypothetical protein Pogu_2047 [Pyrobaculum oguniense TE7]